MTRWIAASLLVLAVCVAAAFPHAARWLIRPVKVDRCDLMVVLSGGAVERLVTAADLMSAGACREVVFVGERAEAAGDWGRGIVADIDPSLIVEPPSVSRSTLGDAMVSLQAARTRGARSLLVVTSPYHTRRVGWVFAGVLGGTEIRFGVYPSSALYMDYARWWAGSYGRGVIASEYVKLGLYGLANMLFLDAALDAARS